MIYYMKSNFIFVICISFLFSFNSKELLYDLTKNKSWKLINEDDKKIYEYKNIDLDCKYFKIEKNITQDPKLVFESIKNIAQYNSIISNKNLYSNLVYVNNDTLYGYQLIKNSIPFTRDRQYIFKMFEVSDDRIDWYILESQNNFSKKLSDSDAKILTLGAGSWKIEYLNDNIVLINKIYVDDEVNMPDMLIQKFRIGNVVDIFNDVLNSVNDKEKDG
tara:strand:+ start:305 stop:958 length:654 start_codon:yes stop_codon:yes gene_type:complete